MFTKKKNLYNKITYLRKTTVSITLTKKRVGVEDDEEEIVGEVASETSGLGVTELSAAGPTRRPSSHVSKVSWGF